MKTPDMKKLSKLKPPEQFIAAVSNGMIPEAEWLLSQGADVNVKPDGSAAIHHVINTGNLTGFKWLLKQSPDLELLDKGNCTPLMLACHQGKVKGSQMAMELLNCGVNVNYRRSDGETALNWAAQRATPEVVEALIRAGAAIDGEPGDNIFPALAAAREGAVENLQTLIKNGCDLGKRTQLSWAKGKTCLGVARIDKRKSVVQYLESIGAPE